MSDATTWQVVHPADLRWRCWEGDEFVVYHPASGDTHLLNRVAAEVIRSLIESPADAATLARRVADRLEGEPDEQLGRRIAKLLEELDQLGLIEPVPQ